MTTTSDETAAPDATSVRRRLLEFYDAHRRELPWRRDAGDPYRVWVSEIMCQQTRVETVVPYYERWFDRFPDIDALAEADEDDVLKAWEGLGYYRRARDLRRAARVVRERYDGDVPSDPAELKKLPGVGEYTAGAVASIAHGVPAPAVDGNVRRVLCRLYDLETSTPAGLRELAASLVPRDRPGDFNQSVMELGATICTPASPACEACPVAGDCLARARGTQEARPEPRPSRPLPESDVGTAVIADAAGRLLLRRRPADGLLGGLWEFPGAEAEDGEAPADAALRIARALLKDGSARGSGGPGATRAKDDDDANGTAARAGPGDTLVAERLGKVTHTFSHRRIHYHAFRVRVEAGTAGRAARRPAAGRGRAGPAADDGPATGPDTAKRGSDGAGPDRETAWAKPDALSAYALPAAQHKIAALARRPGATGAA